MRMNSGRTSGYGARLGGGVLGCVGVIVVLAVVLGVLGSRWADKRAERFERELPARYVSPYVKFESEKLGKWLDLDAGGGGVYAAGDVLTLTGDRRYMRVRQFVRIGTRKAYRIEERGRWSLEDKRYLELIATEAASVLRLGKEAFVPAADIEASSDLWLKFSMDVSMTTLITGEETTGSDALLSAIRARYTPGMKTRVPVLDLSEKQLELGLAEDSLISRVHYARLVIEDGPESDLQIGTLLGPSEPVPAGG